MKCKHSIAALAMFCLIAVIGCESMSTNGGFDEVIAPVWPAFVTGTWQPNQSRWELTFDDQGQLTWMRHFTGVEFVIAEGGLVEPWKGGAEATYFLGPSTVDYDADTRHLRVDILIEHYMISFPNGQMEGSFHDILDGTVSADGKQWKALWISQAAIDGTEKHEPDKKELVFVKVQQAESPAVQ